MATIGRDSDSTGTAFVVSGDNQRLMDGVGTYAAPAGQEVFEVGFYSGTTSGTMEVGVYNTSTNALVASGTVAATATGRQSVAITPVALTNGVTYAVGWRYTNNLQVKRQADVAASVSLSNAIGSSALENPFVDNTSNDGNVYSVFATTQASGGSISSIDSPVTLGSTGNNLTVTNFGGDLTSLIIEDAGQSYSTTLTLSGTDPTYTFSVPDYTTNRSAVGVARCPLTTASWTLQANATDGTDIATSSITLNPGTGWAVIELASATINPGTAFEKFSAPPGDTSQCLYSTVDGTTLTAAGVLDTNKLSGRLHFQLWDVADGKLKYFFVEISPSSTGQFGGLSGFGDLSL